MPSSSPNGKKWIGNCLNRIKARMPIEKILDIGAGDGTYARQFRPILKTASWTAIEIWSDYVSRFKLDAAYDQVINQDARLVDYGNIGPFDVVFAGDVLEHMTKDEAVELVNRLLSNSRSLIISIPIIHMPQGEYMGNPHEVHVKDDWTDQEVRETFSDIIDGTVDQEIGVYLLSQDQGFIESYKRLKIAIYTIAKNEQQHVQRWAKSNAEADIRLVCDTGSTDDTVKLLEEQGAQVVPIRVLPWRFDVARGTALNLLPGDVDVCIWQDLDEELLPGWRAQLEQHWQPDATIANHRYRNNGRPWQWHSKIHARHNCRWTGAVHETLDWTVPEKALWIPELYLDEHQDVGKDRTTYLHLLERKISEGDRNWRTYYFLANDYQMANRTQDSIDTRIKSYEACDDGDVVKSYVAKTIAQQYAALKDHRQANHWYDLAVGHSEERETLFSLAEYCYNNQDWDRCYLAAKRCVAVTQRRDGFTFDPRAWSWQSYDYAALAAHNLGIRAKAIEYGQMALDANPTDVRLQNNLQHYQGSNQ